MKNVLELEENLTISKAFNIGAPLKLTKTNKN